MNIKEIDSQYVANTYARFPVQLQCGKGSLVWDEDGREYIDMGSGIAVNAFGVADGPGPRRSAPSWAGCSTALTSTTPSPAPCWRSSCAGAPA